MASRPFARLFEAPAAVSAVAAADSSFSSPMDSMIRSTVSNTRSVTLASRSIAISASNTGGAWDNAKKYIEAGASEHARALGPKGSDSHKAAMTGDTVGDPLKDTSGLSLNILIKPILARG